MKSNLFFLLVILMPVFASAQVMQAWVKRYNGTGTINDQATSITIDTYGNVYVTGKSYGNGTDFDYATIKYSSTGVEQWIQRYNGPDSNIDYAESIAIDLSGNVYVTGHIRGSGANWDYATVKYTSSGIQQWVQTYSGTGSTDRAFSIAVDVMENVYVTGESIGNGTGYDYATVKYNSSGIEQWVRRYNGPGNFTEQPSCILTDESGNVYITGYSVGNGTNSDFATIKYNSAGVEQWVRRYDGPNNNFDRSTSMVKDLSGNVYVTGESVGNGTEYDYATIKYNSSGVEQWVQRYNGPVSLNDRAKSISIDQAGNVYVTGESVGNGTGYDYVTIKYNSSGVEQWVQRFNGVGTPGNRSDYAESIVVNASGNVYVTGRSFGGGADDDYVTIKYNSTGIEQWVQRYNGPADTTDAAVSVIIDALENVYVTGYSGGSGTSWDYATIKYTQSVGIQQISIEIPSKYSLEQNYPNPFNPTTKIKFDIPNRSVVKLVIYDLLGKEVSSLINEELSAGSYQADWNAGDYPSGVYFYRIETESFVQTKSIVLLK